MSPAQPEPAASCSTVPGLPQPQRAWAAFTLALAIVMSVLDGTMMAVALPTIARELEVTASASIWIVNAYQLTIVVALLPMASLGEILGYRRVYCTGLAVFTLASLLCANSDSLTTLTLARILQGFGAAGVMSLSPALVRFIYPPHRLGRGIALNALVVALAAAFGPTAAAAILYIGPWPWLFAINVPLGCLALVVGMRVLPSLPVSQGRFDTFSALLHAITFGLLIYSIDELGHGQEWPIVAAGISIALVVGYFLVRRQLSRPAPLLPVDLLRNPIISLSIATSSCSFAAQMIAMLIIPFYFHQSLGFGAVETGLTLTAWPLAGGVTAPLAGRLVEHYPAGVLGGIGLALLALGLALLAMAPPGAEQLDLIWRLAICGAGFGLFQSPNNRTIMVTAPPKRSGGAGGLLGTARLFGQSLGAALSALVFAWAPDNIQAVGLGLAAGFAAVGALFSALRLTRRP